MSYLKTCVKKKEDEFIVVKRFYKMKGEGKRGKTNYQDWFFVIHHPNIKNSHGYVSITQITFPKEFIGKKVQFIVRIKEEN